MSVYYHQIMYNYVHIIKFSHDIQFNCNENQTRTFLKKYIWWSQWPPLLFHDTHTLTFTHSLTHCFFSSSKENCFFSNVFVPKKVNAIWAHINIPYYTSFNTQHWVRLIVSYVCETYARISSLSLYLYKYHLSVHVYIYLTNSIYLQIGGVQYFLLINRTYRFTYCFFVFSQT